jgi:cell division topological specificity factor
MNLLAMFRRQPSAPVARERLQVLLAHERTTTSGGSDLLAVLREEILAVIGKHIKIDRDKVKVKLDGDGEISTLEIDVEMPARIPRVERAAAGVRAPA